jgi:hypothetical protein
VTTGGGGSTWDTTAIEFKLLPESLMNTLMRASTLLTGWEFIKSDITQGVKGFFSRGFDENGIRYDMRYERDIQSKVVRGSVSIFDASLAWLVDMDALTSADIDLIRRVRDHRNEVAHELSKYLVDPSAEVNVDLLFQVRDVIRRLGQFWGQFTFAANSDFDGQDVKPEDIHSGSSLLYDYILSLTTVERDEG